MATKQITEYAAITDMDNAGELLVQVGGVTSKITRANLFASTDTVALGGAATVASTLGVTGATSVAALTASGALTVGGFSQFNNNVTIANGQPLNVGNGATALGGTLAVTGATTLTGTLAANDNVTLATAKTLTLAGTADIYTAQGVWTSAPAVLGSVGNPTVTYGTRTHYYKKLGNIVFFSFYIPITAISGGSGDIRIEMPTASVAYAGSAAAGGTILTGLSSLDYEGVAWAWVADASNPFMVLNGTQTGSAMQIAALDSSSVLQGSGFYFI